MDAKKDSKLVVEEKLEEKSEIAIFFKNQKEKRKKEDKNKK